MSVSCVRCALPGNRRQFEWLSGMTITNKCGQVDMALAVFKALFLSFLLVDVMSARHTSYDIGATCSTGITHDGQTAEIKFSFSPQVELALIEHLHLYVTVNDTQDILECNNYDQTVTIQCKVSDKRYKTEGVIDQSLVIVIPEVTYDDDGAYELRGSIKDYFVIPTTCNFRLFGKDGKQDISIPNGNNTLSTFLVFVIGPLLTIGIVVDVICTGMRVFRCRIRRQSTIYERSNIAFRAALKEAFVSKQEGREKQLASTTGLISENVHQQ